MKEVFMKLFKYVAVFIIFPCLIFAKVETIIIDGEEYVRASDYDRLYYEYDNLVNTYSVAVELANFWQSKYEGLFKEYSNLLNDYKAALKNLNSAIALLDDFPKVPKISSPLIDVSGSIFVGYTNNGFIVDLRLSWTPIHLGWLKLGLTGVSGFFMRQFSIGGGISLKTNSFF